MSAEELNREIAFSGQRVKHKAVLAFTLASVMPLLLVTYIAQVPAHEWLGSVFGEGSQPYVLPALLLCTGLLMTAGGFVVWDLATAISRAAHVAAQGTSPEASVQPARQDEIGNLVASVTAMVETIQRQHEEISQFPIRLDQLARQAFRDSLTGLPNRALFVDRLAHALARAERRGELLAVLFLDLDRFKVINDSLGHSAGDAILVEVARRLSGSLRPEDTLARLGGDEFAVLIEDLKDANIPVAVAERLGAEIQRPFVFEGRDLFVTISTGIAVNAAGQTTPEHILRDADLAMYQAKAKGKARCELFDTAMNKPAQERLGLELDLRSAITRGDFALHYQPIVALDTGRIVELEALVRWNHPSRGVLPPAEFVGVSEETGLIVPLGRWILREACRHFHEWHADGASPLSVSVNVSARQLQHPGLVDDIADAVRDARIPASAVRLEITETVVMHDAPATLAKLEALKSLGVRLAIDDFGTGYSSLGYLKRFPVDTLKIDRSFVNGIGRDAEDTAIVNAVITVAKSLGLSVTAEGIEDHDQLEHLRELGCHRGQGYYFTRPVGPDRIPALLAAPPWSRALPEGAIAGQMPCRMSEHPAQLPFDNQELI